jgi:hypothetical protein
MRPIPTEAFAVRFARKPHPRGERIDENPATLTLSRNPVKSNLGPARKSDEIKK